MTDSELFPMAREWRKQTEEHMLSPQVGDRFTEMYAYWVWIEKVDEYGVVAFESQNGEWRRRIWPTQDAFRKTYAYGLFRGYWVHYIDNKPLENDNAPQLDAPAFAG